VVEQGTAASSHQYGIGLNAYADEYVNTKPNRLKNHFYGVRSLTNAGPTIEKLDDQKFDTCSTDTLYAAGAEPSVYGRYLEATEVFDPPSLADGATTTNDITITGAALGDLVTVSFSLDQAGVEMTAYVRVANSVRVILYNSSGGVVDLGSGTMKIRVFK
jgi:hypothetical protein